MAKPTGQLQKLLDAYSAFPEFAGAELARIEQLSNELEKVKDPAWIAFRNNPITQKLYKSAADTYRNSKMTLMNDDGSLEKEERIKLNMSCLWAQWYIKALGGNPKMVQQQVEAEINKMAESVL